MQTKTRKKTTLNTKQDIHFIPSTRPTLTKADIEAVLECLIDEKLSVGENTHTFEKLFSNTFSYKHPSLATYSLTSAYHLAFLALGLGEKDYIILDALSPLAAYDAAKYIGSNIHIIDISSEDCHPRYEKIIETIAELPLEENTKVCYVLQHHFGSIQNFKIQEWLLKSKNHYIIEDTSGKLNTFLEKQQKEMTTSSDEFNLKIPQPQFLSICAMTSSNLFTTAGGAMLTAHSKQMHNQLRSLCYQQKSRQALVAYDYRLNDLQSSMGIKQIQNFSVNLERRREIAKKYIEVLSRFPNIQMFFKEPDKDSYLQFPILTKKPREKIKQAFQAAKIEFSIPELPLHHLLSLEQKEFRNADKFYNQAIFLPIYPSLNSAEINRILQVVCSISSLSEIH